MSSNKNVNPGGNNGLCSPITEFYDGTNDRNFVRHGGSKRQQRSQRCHDVERQHPTHQHQRPRRHHAHVYTEATNYMGGTSRTAADSNANGTAQAENVYFSTEQVGSASTLVPATTPYNVNGIYTDRTTSWWPPAGRRRQCLLSNLLGASRTWNGTTFAFGPANNPDAWQNTTITLPGVRSARWRFWPWQ